MMQIERVAGAPGFCLNGGMAKVLFCLFAVALLLPGCGPAGQKPKPASGAWDRRMAGVVLKVDREEGYVLIRRYGKWRVAGDEVVESRGAGRTANLQPTGEQLGEHVAADIRSGEAREGDAVYIRRILTPGKRETFTNPDKALAPDNQAETLKKP